MIEINETVQLQICVKMVLDAWHSKADKLNKLLSDLSDEQLLKEVSPGRNTGVYLLGHMTVLANSILPLLGYGEHLAPHLIKPFVQTPDQKTNDLASVLELRQEWSKVKTQLEEKFAGTPTNEWFQKHTAVAEEDFAKDPQRNKLNVVLSRVSHMDYHLGQLVFLKSIK